MHPHLRHGRFVFVSGLVLMALVPAATGPSRVASAAEVAPTRPRAAVLVSATGDLTTDARLRSAVLEVVRSHGYAVIERKELDEAGEADAHDLLTRVSAAVIITATSKSKENDTHTVEVRAVYRDREEARRIESPLTSLREDLVGAVDELLSEKRAAAPSDRPAERTETRVDNQWDEPDQERDAYRRRFAPGAVFGFHVGLLASGSGTVESELTSGTASQTEEADYDEKTTAAVGIDLLIAPSHGFRVGLGLLYVPFVKLDIEDEDDDFEVGQNLSAMIVLEPVVPVSERVGIPLRLQGGGTMFLAGGDLEDTIDELDRECEEGKDDGSYLDCEVDKSPFFGWTIGGGPGVIIAQERTRIRLDLRFQYYRVPGIDASAEVAAGADVSQSTTLSGTRFLLSGGVEL